MILQSIGTVVNDKEGTQRRKQGLSKIIKETFNIRNALTKQREGEKSYLTNHPKLEQKRLRAMVTKKSLKVKNPLSLT